MTTRAPEGTPEEPAGDDDDADLAPRPRPGWRSPRPPPLDHHATASLLASGIRGGLGVVCLIAALLYLPPHMVTPILTGVSILMITGGAYGAWRVGVSEPRLKKAARILSWGLSLGCILVFVVTAVLGPGGLAPDWRAVIGEAPPAAAPTIRFEPSEDAPR